jgi:hypothetical protein
MPSDPVASAVEGAIVGGLRYTEEKITDFVNKFLGKELSFIEDKETIEIVKSQRKKPEFEIYRKFVKNKDLRLQMEMGLSLKHLEKNKDKLFNLRSKIHGKFGDPGLHVAELVACGIFNRYIALILNNAADEKELEERMEEILRDIEKYVIFIQAFADAKKICEALVIRISANLPKAIIIFSKGESAIEIAKTVIEDAKIRVDGYHFEYQLNPDSNERYDFILKKSTADLQSTSSTQ